MARHAKAFFITHNDKTFLKAIFLSPKYCENTAVGFYQWLYFSHTIDIAQNKIKNFPLKSKVAYLSSLLHELSMKDASPEIPGK